MLQKRKRLNPALITCLGILINILGTTLLTQNHLKADAQTAIQVRTDQWLKVDKAMGNVKYRNFYNYANRAAKVGDRLQATSDEISTGVNSSAVLSIDTGVGSIYVEENTTIQIRSFGIANDNGRIINLSIPRGRARLQIRKFTNRGSQLNIQTPAVVMGVRGTDYVLNVKDDGRTILSTFEGSVMTEAQNTEVLVDQGFQNQTILGEPPSQPVPIQDNNDLEYQVFKQFENSGHQVTLAGQVDFANTVTIDGVEQAVDRNGQFRAVLTTNSIYRTEIKVIVSNPLGKQRIYELVIF